jgi:histidyl-tRNA synthetase
MTDIPNQNPLPKQSKPQKLRARQARGFADRTPADIRATDAMVAKIKAVYERYGFDPVETPLIEYTDALGKFLPDSDRPNEGVFSFRDDDEQWLSLRYDLTAPLARHVAENFQHLNLPYRTYRAGWVFRNEKPGPGRFRQFMQFDADTVGAPGVQADAEMCMMMADTLEALGIQRGDYVIRVNNRKVLDGVMEAIGVTDAGQKLAVLRAIDKLDKFGIEGVRLLLGAGRKDESGDFTKGAGLGTTSILRLMSLFELEKWTEEARAANPVYHAGVASGEIDTRKDEGIRADGIFGGLKTALGDDSRTGTDGLHDLRDIWKLMKSCGYDDGRIRIDPSVVRGLEYYTGPVYEAELTAKIPNEKGEFVVFGSVGGGGRYDGLVKRFTGQDVPATGFSIGVSRLMTALKNLGKLDGGEMAGPVVVCVMDKDVEALGDYQKMVMELRNYRGPDFPDGIRAEMFQGNPKQFGKQLQYADRRGSPICIIAGTEERTRQDAEGNPTPVVQLKDMIEGRRQAEAIESNEEYRAARVGQFEIARADLVSEVRRVLDEQKIG